MFGQRLLNGHVGFAIFGRRGDIDMERPRIFDDARPRGPGCNPDFDGVTRCHPMIDAPNL